MVADHLGFVRVFAHKGAAIDVACDPTAGLRLGLREVNGGEIQTRLLCQSPPPLVASGQKIMLDIALNRVGNFQIAGFSGSPACACPWVLLWLLRDCLQMDSLPC